ncbi:hypothetical protein [Nostoc sp. CALU 1950]|uniref:hypothetical protein n=1 Tax=Nostoc sp. CALU 1950 TaxID=3104321 RepID=UPI003EB8712C
MKKAINQPPISSATLSALNYLHDLPDRVIQERYLNIKTVEQGNGKILLEAMHRYAKLTNNWRQAFLMNGKELQNICAASEAAPYRSYAEASLARRAMAEILYQDFYPEFDRFQEKFDSFEEFWCAVEWDLMYRAMRGSGLINITEYVSDDVIEKIKPQGKRKWIEYGFQFLKYLDDPSKVQFNQHHKLCTVAESLYFYAMYHGQQDDQFRRRELAEFTATLKRCHREIRNNNLQLGYLLEDRSLVIFEKHKKKVLKPHI